jgi:hypothetical protein
VKELADGVPGTLWQMVEQQIARLAPGEQATLTVAAVAGVEFSAAIAAAPDVSVEEAERRCEALARRGQFVRSAGVSEWPDGTVAGRYAFIHALYQHVLYARIPAGARAELHRWTGARLEQGHGHRTVEIAGELAMHYTEGRDFSRAARYHPTSSCGRDVGARSSDVERRHALRVRSRQATAPAFPGATPTAAGDHPVLASVPAGADQ